MPDLSALDLKYFVDNRTYNCPFCNRRNVVYVCDDKFRFHWTASRRCFGYIMVCSSCGGRSMHLSYDDFGSYNNRYYALPKDIDLDAKFFYSVPTSFFVQDERIPRVLRELITEAEACHKMNLLTGASACARKAIYELVHREGAEGPDYEGRIKALKAKHPEVDPVHFDVLAHIQGMTSDKVHEQSWDKWDSRHLQLILETVRAVLHEIYVVPDERRIRAEKIRSLRGELLSGKSELVAGDADGEVVAGEAEGEGAL